MALAGATIVVAFLLQMHTPPATAGQQVAATPLESNTVSSDYLAANLLAKAAIAEVSYTAFALQSWGSKGPIRREVDIEWETGRLNTGTIYRIAQEHVDIAFAELPVRAVLEPVGLSAINQRVTLTAALVVSLIEDHP